MTVHAMPWNPATKGLIEAEVVPLAGTAEYLLKDLDKFNRKIVLIGPINPTKDVEGSARLEKQLYKEIGKRAVAMLSSMEHTDGKFEKYGSPFDKYFDDYFGGWPRLPHGFLIQEDRSMLVRLLRKGQKVRMALRLGGEITKTQVQERNVVGEIRGSEKPNEVVIVGGHLDSWDLGTGATDNGTGSIATLESLRAMKKLGLKPKRTIRFVLFTGEEQGSTGAEAYVAAHKAELPDFQAVLIHDIGAGKPSGFTIQGYKEWIPALRTAMAPLSGIGVTGIPVERHWDSDQDCFVVAGVPGFFLDQDITDYFASTHHSQTDMFNHVKADEYLPSVEALAVTAWEFANMDQRVPHVTPRKDGWSRKGREVEATGATALPTRTFSFSVGLGPMFVSPYRSGQVWNIRALQRIAAVVRSERVQEHPTRSNIPARESPMGDSLLFSILSLGHLVAVVVSG